MAVRAAATSGLIFLIQPKAADQSLASRPMGPSLMCRVAVACAIRTTPTTPEKKAEPSNSLRSQRFARALDKGALSQWRRRHCLLEDKANGQ
jgi:hypothetical protein